MTSNSKIFTLKSMKFQANYDFFLTKNTLQKLQKIPLKKPFQKKFLFKHTIFALKLGKKICKDFFATKVPTY